MGFFIPPSPAKENKGEFPHLKTMLDYLTNL
jgi:hypothetical protein